MDRNSRDFVCAPSVTTVVIDHINTAKALSYAATGADTGHVLLHSRFPEISELAIGAVIEIGHPENGTQAQDWRASTVETIPGFYETVHGTLTRGEGKPFAFIRCAQQDACVPPATAARFTPGQSYEVTCKALWRTNKHGKADCCALGFVDS